MATSRISRTIPARPQLVWDAFMDPASLVQWLPPAQMTGKIHEFRGEVGGGYVMSLFYPADETPGRGKTTANEDRVHVRFVDLQPPRRIVQAVTFDTEDPTLKGEMTMTVTLIPSDEGTRVALDFENLPPGLRPEDNDEGARLSLEQLAARFR